MLHKFNGVFGLLFLLLAVEIGVRFVLLDVVVDLNHFLYKLIPFSIDLALHHVLSILHRELNDLSRLSVNPRLLSLRRDLIDKLYEVIVSVLDLLEYFVVNEELHIGFELLHFFILLKLDVEARALHLRVLDYLLGLVLALLSLRVQPLEHLVELVRVERYVHF